MKKEKCIPLWLSRRYIHWWAWWGHVHWEHVNPHLQLPLKWTEYFFMVNYIYGSHFIIILNKEWPPLFLANLYSDKLMYNSKSVLSQCNYIVVFCPSLIDSIMSQDRKTNTKYTFLFIVLFSLICHEMTKNLFS